LQQKHLKQKAKVLLETCETSAKTALKEWKVKLVKRMVEQYREDTEQLAEVVESIKEATGKINNHLSSLEEGNGSGTQDFPTTIIR
jgi:gamma-glutamyl:cysteine ligase YbdK (ATP-grasp superfamily)